MRGLKGRSFRPTLPEAYRQKFRALRKTAEHRHLELARAKREAFVAWCRTDYCWRRLQPKESAKAVMATHRIPELDIVTVGCVSPSLGDGNHHLTIGEEIEPNAGYKAFVSKRSITGSGVTSPVNILRDSGNFKPLDKWQSFKAIFGGIRTYTWTPARSHVHHLIHYKYSEVFRDSPGWTTEVVHDIDVGGAVPIKQSPYRIHPQQVTIIQREIDAMLSMGLIRPGKIVPAIDVGGDDNRGRGGNANRSWLHVA
ncbi:hypothetical protein E2C01_035086 [Portunus trituberculatus]|uniref:Uncharacterized protein n=1 Tax=Portunus trituberculatus TaxID=210409 RepID=A0A5B7F8S9_PORTR|nr:hypothetical protein [Portunus trituberculatus]